MNSEGNVSIITKKQTDGIGRNKKWVSPEGNLYMTTCTPIDKNNNIVSLPLIVSLSIVNALSEKFDTDKFKIKWPNDIILNGKKVGGVLIKTVEKSNNYYAIIGIGINLNEDITIKDRILWPASSIKKELNLEKKIDFIKIARKINRLMIINIQKLISESFTLFNEEYLNKLILTKMKI